MIAGARSDHSELTGRWSLDPRLSLAYRPQQFITLTAAWGIYHQVAAPLQYDSVAGTPGLPSMRASQIVLGMQLGDDPWLWRVEAYEKRYHDLVQLTRDEDGVQLRRASEDGQRWVEVLARLEPGQVAQRG